VVLWQGFIKPYKGISFLLDSWSKLHQRTPDARLFIVGTGDSRLLEAISEHVHAAGVQDSVELVFRFVSRSELSDYYRAADIIVYPYREVTTSGALLTGLNYHKPIIATALPPFQELLSGHGAVLLDYGDVDALAGALAHLVKNPSDRELMAASLSRLHASWTEIAARTVECYGSASLARQAGSEVV
jgi:glycosyltransferase involved in cell wall biosynthesis